MYGYNKEIPLAGILGILLVCVSTCGLPALYFLLKYIRRRRKKRLQAYKAQKDSEKARVTYENPLGIREDEVTWQFCDEKF